MRNFLKVCVTAPANGFSIKKKTVKISFLNNFRSSRPEVF